MENKFRVIQNNKIIGEIITSPSFNCGSWFSVDYSLQEDDRICYSGVGYLFPKLGKDKPLSKLTYEQYIGRKSISDKEVYSGDKVNIIDRDGKKYNDLTVLWDDEFCGFKAENEDWKLFFYRIEYIEIIGNIHEGE